MELHSGSDASKSPGLLSDVIRTREAGWRQKATVPWSRTKAQCLAVIVRWKKKNKNLNLTKSERCCGEADTQLQCHNCAEALIWIRKGTFLLGRARNILTFPTCSIHQLHRFTVYASIRARWSLCMWEVGVTEEHITEAFERFREG